MAENEILRNKLNLEIRALAAVVDMIKGTSEEYEDYKENSMSEEEFLKIQIEIISKLKNKLVDIFK